MELGDTCQFHDFVTVLCRHNDTNICSGRAAPLTVTKDIQFAKKIHMQFGIGFEVGHALAWKHLSYCVFFHSCRKYILYVLISPSLFLLNENKNKYIEDKQLI